MSGLDLRWIIETIHTAKAFRKTESALKQINVTISIPNPPTWASSKHLSDRYIDLFLFDNLSSRHCNSKQIYVCS